MARGREISHIQLWEYPLKLVPIDCRRLFLSTFFWSIFFSVEFFRPSFGRPKVDRLVFPFFFFSTDFSFRFYFFRSIFFRTTFRPTFDQRLTLVKKVGPRSNRGDLLTMVIKRSTRFDRADLLVNVGRKLDFDRKNRKIRSKPNSMNFQPF